MTRNFLIDWLIRQDCFPDNDCDSDISQLWHNGLNGETCYVPREDELDVTTYCHIIYELKIEPPLEFEADYYVYSNWRTSQVQNINRS